MKLLLKSCVLLLLSIFMLASNASCINEGISLQEPTNNLIIYDAPNQTDFIRKAITLFKQKFPEVDVEFREFGGLRITNPNFGSNYASYIETLTSELATGRGPDVLIWSADYSRYLKLIQICSK